jgi:nucleotidyltransferase/DNA polymerase involved in DNA repair
MDTRSQPTPTAILPPTPGWSRPRISAILVEPFALWLAERRTPELARTPLVACEEGRVLHANASARRHGIARGMRLAGARLRATGLAIAASDEPSLQHAWQAFSHDLYRLTPWLDARQQGRAYARLDEREAQALALHLRARIGVADDLESATLAALAARPGEARSLPPDGVEGFLERLPLRFLRGVGLGEGDLTRLHWLGLQSVADLARWSPGQVRAYLGASADSLLPYLHGPRQEQLSTWSPPPVLRRTALFDPPIREPADVNAALDQLSRSLALALRNRAASLVGVVVSGPAGVWQRARRAKEPLRSAGRIRQQAALALQESGASEHGIERLSIELSNPEAHSQAVRLWPQREQREVALTAVLERYPEALVVPHASDPHAPVADLASHWGPLHDPSGSAADPRPGHAKRTHPSARLLAAGLGSVPPQTLHSAPPLAASLPTARAEEATAALPAAPAQPLPRWERTPVRYPRV